MVQFMVKLNIIKLHNITAICQCSLNHWREKKASKTCQSVSQVCWLWCHNWSFVMSQLTFFWLWCHNCYSFDWLWCHNWPYVTCDDVMSQLIFIWLIVMSQFSALVVCCGKFVFFKRIRRLHSMVKFLLKYFKLFSMVKYVIKYNLLLLFFTV